MSAYFSPKTCPIVVQASFHCNQRLIFVLIADSIVIEREFRCLLPPWQFVRVRRRCRISWKDEKRKEIMNLNLCIHTYICQFGVRNTQCVRNSPIVLWELFVLLRLLSLAMSCRKRIVPLETDTEAHRHETLHSKSHVRLQIFPWNWPVLCVNINKRTLVQILNESNAAASTNPSLPKTIRRWTTRYHQNKPGHIFFCYQGWKDCLLILLTFVIFCSLAADGASLLK